MIELDEHSTITADTLCRLRNIPERYGVPVIASWRVINIYEQHVLLTWLPDHMAWVASFMIEQSENDIAQTELYTRDYELAAVLAENDYDALSIRRVRVAP